VNQASVLILHPEGSDGNPTLAVFTVRGPRESGYLSESRDGWGETGVWVQRDVELTEISSQNVRSTTFIFKLNFIVNFKAQKGEMQNKLLMIESRSVAFLLF
jgi:hypothetical protein